MYFVDRHMDAKYRSAVAGLSTNEFAVALKYNRHHAVYADVTVVIIRGSFY